MSARVRLDAKSIYLCLEDFLKILFVSDEKAMKAIEQDIDW